MINGVSRLHELSELRRQEFRQTGVPSFDGMTGGLVRGGICELSGPDGSGKRGLALRMAACSTDRGGLCAVVDGTDGFDPISAQGSGLSLSKTVWVRCGGDLTKSIMSTEYLVSLQGRPPGFTHVTRRHGGGTARALRRATDIQIGKKALLMGR